MWPSLLVPCSSVPCSWRAGSGGDDGGGGGGCSGGGGGSGADGSYNGGGSSGAAGGSGAAGDGHIYGDGSNDSSDVLIASAAALALLPFVVLVSCVLRGPLMCLGLPFCCS